MSRAEVGHLVGNAVLIVEDSRADRARFRRVLAETDVTFEFAWSWEDDGSPGVMPWFRRHLHNSVTPSADERAGSYLLRLLNAVPECDLLMGYKLLVLDLAWSNSSEATMREEQGMTLSRARDLASDHAKSPRLEELIASVEGIALLEWRRSRNIDLPMWVTSAYVPAGAEGIREFLRQRYNVVPESALFHKWIDEEPLRADLVRFCESRGSE